MKDSFCSAGRSFFLLTLAAGSLVLGGCAAPLNVQTSTGNAASVIGVPAPQIRFISYCGWGTVPLGDKYPEGGGDGLLVLTNDSIILMEGNLPAVMVRRKIKFKEIDGVDVRHFGRARQLQILLKDVITLMEITKNKALVDQEGTERAAQILRDHGVPPFKSTKYYRPKTPIPIFIYVP